MKEDDRMRKARLQALRDKMEERKIDAYIIPTADFHQSEYVGDYFTAREYISGFTGSAGILVVAKEEAGLWTDGRYFIQAAKELEGSTITLYRQGIEEDDTIEEFLKKQVKRNGCIGFDGRVIDAAWGELLCKYMKEKQISIAYKEDLVQTIWENRPELSREAVYILEEQYAGESVKSKLQRIRKQMKEVGAKYHIISTLDDIAWTLNLRGNDVLYNPVILSYLMITEETVMFYVNEEKLSSEVQEYLKSNQITIASYEEIYHELERMEKGSTILLDKTKVNYAIVSSIPDGVSIINKTNPTILMKAVKNEIEINNLIAAHIKDGVAVTKFMYWLKKNIGTLSMTEVTASDYLEECRKEQKGFISLSFDTICAYKENAAMMHYSAKPESCKVLEPQGLLLVDSGGQYYEGTTDITRTIALGPVEVEQKKHFTAVVNGMLNLSDARFLHGCTGLNLDILARGPLWNLDLDYRCGTGHGVGYLLNVHEAPNGFRWKVVPERHDNAVLEEGMVTTNEPGVYIEGSHGIRIENELVCRKGTKNEYGQFMKFETITVAPIDLDAIDVSQMSVIEQKRLDSYHQKVYETLQPYFHGEELEWLKEATRSCNS